MSTTRVLEITPDQSSDIIIPLIMILLLAIAIIIAASGVVSSPKTTVGPVLLECPVDMCATNIFNGNKRCPNLGRTILANPGYEVCNSPNLCDNPITPFAVQTDGSISTLGTCPQGIVCRCLRRPECAEYVTSIFNTRNGSPYNALNTQRIVFSQSNSYIDSATQQPSSLPPIQYDDPVLSFCTIPPDWILRSQPGCNFITEITPTSLGECMNGASSNPCLQGTLAVIPNTDATEWNISQIQQSRLACVRGEKCPIGKITVWDQQLGAVICK